MMKKLTHNARMMSGSYRAAYVYSRIMRYLLCIELQTHTTEELAALATWISSLFPDYDGDTYKSIFALLRNRSARGKISTAQVREEIPRVMMRAIES